jgi:hypothetical protein
LDRITTNHLTIADNSDLKRQQELGVSRKAVLSKLFKRLWLRKWVAQSIILQMCDKFRHNLSRSFFIWFVASTVGSRLSLFTAV